MRMSAIHPRLKARATRQRAARFSLRGITFACNTYHSDRATFGAAALRMGGEKGTVGRLLRFASPLNPLDWGE